MTSVSERLKNFEKSNGDVKEAHTSSRARSPTRTRRTSPHRTFAGTYGSRRRARSNDNRIDLSDDEMDMDSKRRAQKQQQQQQQEHDLHLEASEPPLLKPSISAKHERPESSEPNTDLVDLDLIARSLSTRKLQTDSLPLTKDEMRRSAEEDEGVSTTNRGVESQNPRWSIITNIFKDPLADEKKLQEELMLKHMKETDSSFSEEAYHIEKQTQDTFINTKKEEAETVRVEKERQKAERDARTRMPFWEKIVQTTMAVFINSVEAEKRQQEHILFSHLHAMDSSVAEDDIRRQKEAQATFVELKRREAERQRILHMEEVEKQKRDAMLAENMRLPDGLQSEDGSLMMQNSIIVQGAKIQEALRSSLFQAANFYNEEEEGESPSAPQVPLHIQKQLQQALLLQQASENPDIQIDEEALRHSQEIQESLIFYAKKNQRTSWLDSFIPQQRSSIPQEVSFDDAASVGSRISWLSGGFGGGGGGSVSRSWRSSFSKADKVESPKKGANGLRSSWQMRGSSHNPKVGKDWAEANLHLAGHAEESESANSDL